MKYLFKLSFVLLFIPNLFCMESGSPKEEWERLATYGKRIGLPPPRLSVTTLSLLANKREALLGETNSNIICSLVREWVTQTQPDSPQLATLLDSENSFGGIKYSQENRAGKHTAVIHELNEVSSFFEKASQAAYRHRGEETPIQKYHRLRRQAELEAQNRRFSQIFH